MGAGGPPSAWSAATAARFGFPELNQVSGLWEQRMNARLGAGRRPSTPFAGGRHVGGDGADFLPSATLSGPLPVPVAEGGSCAA